MEDHIDHGRAHVGAADPRAGEVWCDLGSGGGVPGLILALLAPESEVVLLDRAVSRCTFLQSAVSQLDLTNASVLEGDAAQLAHDAKWREAFDGIVSRAFGPPAAVAEVSSGLLRVGGRVIVSEPPSGATGDRWPSVSLASIGFDTPVPVAGDYRFVRLVKSGHVGGTTPRSWKRIRKRPLF